LYSCKQSCVIVVKKTIEQRCYRPFVSNTRASVTCLRGWSFLFGFLFLFFNFLPRRCGSLGDPSRILPSPLS